jgi:putative CocE/NonD family hydrolase
MGQQIIADFDVPAQMRDGVVLRANIYRPASDGQWPVLLTRLPYGKDYPLSSALMDPAQVARRGYVVVIQDTRGRMTSEGDWDPMRNEIFDGADTVAWAASLPYSNGSVGMYGISYFAFTQWAAALTQPSALKAIVPMMTWNDPLNGVLFRGGALELGSSAYWQLSVVGIDVLLRRHRANPDPRELGMALYMLVQDIDTLGTHGYASLPLREFAPLQRSAIAPAFFESFDHPMDREHADLLTIQGKHELVQVPALNVAGWYDIFLEDTIEHFRQLRSQGSTPEARQSQLLIGPWTHGGMSGAPGEMNFGFASGAALIDLKIDLTSLQLRWFDHYLKGIDTGLTAEAPVKLFVMGANVWRDEQEWPLARALETRYYLHSAGHAQSLSGDGLLSTSSPAAEPSDAFLYDPSTPVPTRGGALMMTPEFRPGPFDQRSIEGRDDVLVYSTPVLEEDIEVTGPISVHLWAISSAPDTDFVARLVDVHPDGYAQNLTDGIIRARYRSFTQDGQVSLLEAGRIYEYDINLWATSNLFKKGHRIRLDITSSSFPRWDRNPNTGHDLGADSEMVVAQQTILHDAEHPSYILLPVIPVA